MKVSCIINCDSRPERQEQSGLFNGAINADFLTDGIFNKAAFLKDFDTELIVFVDKHEELSDETIRYLHSICDIVCIRKHTSEPGFNDWNYQRALRLATGEIVMHFDQDVAAFTSSPQEVQNLIDLLEKYSFISYPSPNSPYAAHDSTFDYAWASTRFFVCKREMLNLSELDKMQRNYEYCYETYPASRKEHWTEHLLGLYAKYRGNGVYYPPIDISKLAIFTWGKYEKYTLRRLNEMPYEEIKNYIQRAGGIHYPCDLVAF